MRVDSVQGGIQAMSPSKFQLVAFYHLPFANTYLCFSSSQNRISLDNHYVNYGTGLLMDTYS